MAEPNSRKGFVIASLLHVGVFGTLAVAVLVSHFKKDPEPIILTLESPPSDQPKPKQPENPSPNFPEINTPEVERIEQIDLPDIPDIPQPEPVTPPPPAPAPIKATPKPTKPEPQPKPEPAPKAMTMEQFRKLHGAPKKTTKRQSVPKPTKPTPRINVPDVTSALNDFLQDSSTSNSSESEQKALLAYIHRLHRQIEIAWQKPDMASTNEWAEVGITLAANGKITGFKVLRKKCGSVFLQSITEAINSTRSIGPTPSGKPISVKYTFRLTDQ